ncbi:MAG: glycosyl hydrolase, partial [Gemmatimonadetes bacterium]|nr:glycosyl hydrolase [Gemmatimonadota bacterium]
AALGHAFGPNPERGLFRSRDGGKAWDKILFISDSTGVVDLAMDPTNPRILYAAAWRGERQPWAVISGSWDSGVYRSRDGGDTWEKVANGLPSGIVGRVGVAIAASNPRRIYAVVQHSEVGGLYRSDDGGESFEYVNQDRLLFERAWYYGHIYVDPKDPNTVYTLTTRLYKSTDGGRSFAAVPQPHVDNHDLWINPDDPRIMASSQDGGVAVTVTGGKTWSTVLNQPTAEIYRLEVDNRFPYRVYGAQQDNSTISLPSVSGSTLTPYEDWYQLGGGESGYIAVDPRNPDVVFAGSYGGEITRVDRTSGQTRNMSTYPTLVVGQAPKNLKYRFQWNAPIEFSLHDPNVLYHASNHLHRSTDGGETWEVIGPDLTRNDKSKQEAPGGPIDHDITSVETYGTIFTVAESPQRAGEIWIGTDDGLAHITRDGGAHWENITPGGMPEGTVNVIDLSEHTAGRAFLTMYRYRQDDFRPYVYRTDDYGKTWTLLTNGRNGIPADHFVRVVREDPGRKGLLYAGTEFGMYLSFDDGAHWQPIQLNLPLTPVTDLKIYRNDLVVATQGRSLWILDDVTPLRQLTTQVASAPAHLFKPRDTHRMEMAGRSRSGASRAGENPPRGALIFYTFAQAPAQELTLEILDAGGSVVRSFTSQARGGDRVGAKAGMNRFVWDLRYPGVRVPENIILRGGPPAGAVAVPGTYQVRLSSGGWSQTQAFQVLMDPRIHATVADLQAQRDLQTRINGRIKDTYDAVEQIRALKAQLQSRAREGDDTEKRAMAALEQRLTEVEGELLNLKFRSEKDPLNFEPKLDNLLAYLSNLVGEGDGRPTEAMVAVFVDLDGRLEVQLSRLRELMNRAALP